MMLENEEEDSKFYEKAYTLISVLKRQGHEMVYIADSKFKDYEEIFMLISYCNCLLAFTDKYTLSCTWRTSEITYAQHGVGIFEKVDFHIPVFLYRAIDDHNTPFLESLVRMQDVFVLPVDASSAAQVINVAMNDY